MKTMTIIFFGVFILLPAITSLAAPTTNTVEDLRKKIKMPYETELIMRKHMQEHLSVISQLIGALANGDYEKISTLAENKLGNSSRQPQAHRGKGPGRFMPTEMRNLGWGMHDAASELAKVALKKDLKRTTESLQGVTNYCVSCHYQYRLE